MKPIANLEEIVFTDVEDNGYYTSQRAQFSDGIGARKLGYNLTVLPPGKAQCPFHNHHGEEEMFLILEGEGELRFGEQRYPIRRHDVIACPTGGREVAHQIINTGTVPMRYLAVSNAVEIETCEYPDSNKIMVGSGRRGEPGLWKMFRAENTVEYYDRESNQPLPRDRPRYNLSKTALLATPLVLPPIDERNAIAQVLSDIDTAITTRQARYRNLKQVLLQVLLTGRIRLIAPGSAQPAAGPASA